MENKFSKVISSKTNGELTEILKSKQDYQKEFIDELENELEARNFNNKSEEELLNALQTQNPYLIRYTLIREELIKRGRESDVIKMESEVEKIESLKNKGEASTILEKQKTEKRKRTLPYRIAFTIIGGIIGFFLIKNHLEKNEKENIKTFISNSISEETNESITNISLLKESSNKYKGIVSFRSGNEMRVSVIVDGDEFMWESDGSYERQNSLNNLESAAQAESERLERALKEETERLEKAMKEETEKFEKLQAKYN